MTTSNQPVTRLKRVLVVDDESSITELLQEVLEDEGYKVVIAKDGRDGLAQLERSAVDVVLCDIMMPFMNGFQMCRAMQQSGSAFRHIPLVFMSAAGPPGAGQGCAYAAFVPKPFHLDQLFEVIAGLSLKRPSKPEASGLL